MGAFQICYGSAIKEKGALPNEKFKETRINKAAENT
jgi:hypothetical protein